MSGLCKASIGAVAPYAAWMAMMLALPPTPVCYAIRTFACLALLVFLSVRWYGTPRADSRSLAWGLAAGLTVLAVWVFPERWEWYRRFCTIGDGGTVEIDGSAAYLKAIRLFGSAFVIAPAEELFFRSFLYRWIRDRNWTSVPLREFDMGAFLWSTALFALEHDRILVGAIAGAIYALVAIRVNLAAAIVAHATTNLALGVYVLASGNWTFW